MFTTIRKANDPQFDADTITLALDDGSEILVYVFESADGVPFVQIDTNMAPDTSGPGRFKVAVNDGTIWNADADEDVVLVDGTLVNR